jgi:hypothetical protein
MAEGGPYKREQNCSEPGAGGEEAKVYGSNSAAAVTIGPLGGLIRKRSAVRPISGSQITS